MKDYAFGIKPDKQLVVTTTLDKQTILSYQKNGQQKGLRFEYKKGKNGEKLLTVYTTGDLKKLAEKGEVNALEVFVDGNGDGKMKGPEDKIHVAKYNPKKNPKGITFKLKELGITDPAKQLWQVAAVNYNKAKNAATIYASQSSTNFFNYMKGLTGKAKAKAKKVVTSLPMRKAPQAKYKATVEKPKKEDKTASVRNLDKVLTSGPFFMTDTPVEFNPGNSEHAQLLEGLDLKGYSFRDITSNGERVGVVVGQKGQEFGIYDLGDIVNVNFRKGKPGQEVTLGGSPVTDYQTLTTEWLQKMFPDKDTEVVAVTKDGKVSAIVIYDRGQIERITGNTVDYFTLVPDLFSSTLQSGNDVGGI
jgi:hypothetical protein